MRSTGLAIVLIRSRI